MSNHDHTTKKTRRAKAVQPAPAPGLRVLHVASEAMPLIKTGGLADVVSALPTALVAQGFDARVAIPGYAKAIRAAEKLGLEWHVGALTIEAGGVDHRVGVGQVTVNGVVIYLLANNELFGRDGIYGPGKTDYDDNARRFSVFCKAALALPQFLRWIPHLVHAHDWQAGLVPALLQRGFLHDLPATRSVFTVHNIAYQGAFWHWDMKLTGLDWSLFNPLHLEHFGKLNFLKAGIVFAERVTTVSRRYAEELQTEEYGFGLDVVIKGHAYKLSGITNGVDGQEWDPASDPHLPARFQASDLAGKRVCKARLQAQLGLVQRDDVCLVGVVSRLDWQKGLDLILATVGIYIIDGRMQLVVLGEGDQGLTDGFHALQHQHPGWVAFRNERSEELAHRIVAGSDLLLVPSRFEPCGLTQLYAMRYGTLPLVRYTGGLADTVTDVATGHGTGFTFGPIDAGHFSSVLDRSLGLHRDYTTPWREAQLRAMQADFSWRHPAEEYGRLYRSLVTV